MTTVADWFRAAIPPDGDALIDRAGLRCALAAARGFPGSCLSILESRLGPGRDRLPDVSVRLTEAGEARTVLDRNLLPDPSPFLTDWASSPAVARHLRALWLEMDLSRSTAPGAAPPEPVLAVRVAGEVSRSRSTPAERARHLLEIPPRLLGASSPPLPAAQSRRLRLCLEALPPSAYVLYFFNLRARGSRAIRVELFGPAEADVLPYLRSVGEERAAGAVAEALALTAGADRLHLSFEIGTEGELLPRLGLEYALARLPGREASGALRWRDLLERLLERELATREQAEACLAWTGWETASTAPERWPLKEPGTPVAGACARALSHLKLVCRPGEEGEGELEAKVYRAVQHLPGKGGQPVPEGAERGRRSSK